MKTTLVSMQKCFKILFTIILILFSIHSFCQKDQVLRLGYRAGYTKFNPAYYTTSLTDGSTVNTKIKDRILPTNWDIWYGRYSDHVFYDANIGGMVYAFADYVGYLFKGTNPQWLNEKMKFKGSGGEINRGSDFDIFDFKLAFGGGGVFLGVQAGYTKFGSYPNVGISNPPATESTWQGLNNYGSYGFGAHLNFKVDDMFLQNSLTFDWLRNKKFNDMRGKGIKLETVILLGDDKGFYVSPYLKWRFFNNTLTAGT